MVTVAMGRDMRTKGGHGREKKSSNHQPFLGTSQYSWEYGTGKFATGPPVILGPQLDGATGYFEG